MLPTLLTLLAGLSLGEGGSDAQPAVASSPWGRDYFPNTELVTHQGQRVRFFDDLIANKVVVISFIYTSCPDACPLETARLAGVQEALGGRVGQDVFFYSISIDPARDTVEALAKYAERFGAGPGWQFLRGEEEDVLELRRKLGVLGANETKLEEHSLSVVIGNQATGRWMRRSPFENAYVLADEIGAWLHNWKSPTVIDEDYADAPELRSVSKGEALFRTRCSACHVIGPGDGLTRSGPNLQGVVEWRDRAWLERWIREPDRMLVEGDSLALTLFESYQRVPMPNMRLNELEVAAVIEFMQEESERTLALESRSGPETPAPTKGCCLEKEAPAVIDDWDSPPPAVDQADSRGATPAPGPTLLGSFALLFLAGGLASASTHRESPSLTP
jgi:protein SCO1/2